MSHNPTDLAYVSPLDRMAADDLTIGQLKRLRRAGRAIKRRAARVARTTFLLPGRAGRLLAAGAKRAGMAPATLLARLRSADTKRKQAAVRAGIITLAKKKQADMKRGRQPWSWEQSVAWSKARFEQRGLPTKVQISGAWVTSGENVAYADDIGAPPGPLKYLLWLNPMSWFAASIRHTINQFKPEYGERPGWSPEAWKAAQRKKEQERVEQESSEEPAEEESAEEEAPEGEGEGEMEGIRRRFISKKVAGFKGGFLANLAARCAAGDRRACAIKERIRQKAAAGNRRAANTYHALSMIQRRGLSGIAGDDTGYVPVAAYAASKYGPEMARFAMKNKGLIKKAEKVVSKAKAGDKQANARIRMIDAGSKAGDVEAQKAKTALLLAKEKRETVRKPGIVKIKAD